MPRASFSHSVELPNRADSVWDTLQAAETWAGIGPVDEVWAATHDDAGGLASFQWSAHVGPTKYKGTAAVAIADPPHHMKLNLNSSELTGSLITDIDEGDSPLLSVTLEVVSKGTMASLFFPIIAEAIGRGLPQQVEAFAAGLSGERNDPPHLRSV